MRPLAELSSKRLPRLKVLFTDIDDTLTNNGLLRPTAFNSLWRLHQAGLAVVPVTGRPAGWCELIARQWPVAAVIGENGAFYFRYDPKRGRMLRKFASSETLRRTHRRRLKEIETRILKKFKRARVASDQFTRLFDLAIDFREDVRPPLGLDVAHRIQAEFKKSGATAKVSSIHVNGWFGRYDKLAMCKRLHRDLFGRTLAQDIGRAAFVGDSPNDEPMFKFFKWSFGVANVREYSETMIHLPAFVTELSGGDGFAEIANRIVASTNRRF
jgi:HAD superfamily hydrolase (TIGR01484 family)